MNRTLLTLLCLLSLVGCVKVKGERGEKGDAGPGAIKLYTGVITSDEMFFQFPVPQSEIATWTVYFNDGTDSLELPYFIPSEGVNTFAGLSQNGGGVQIQMVNGLKAGASHWQVVLVLK